MPVVSRAGKPLRGYLARYLDYSEPGGPWGSFWGEWTWMAAVPEDQVPLGHFRRFVRSRVGCSGTCSRVPKSRVDPLLAVGAVWLNTLQPQQAFHLPFPSISPSRNRLAPSPSSLLQPFLRLHLIDNAALRAPNLLPLPPPDIFWCDSSRSLVFRVALVLSVHSFSLV